MQIKLCGFSEINSIKTAIDHGCDYIGVVFVKKSIRYIEPSASYNLAKAIDNKCKKVAVVANQNLEELIDIYKNFQPDYFQLHGDENISFINSIKQNIPNIKFIKALSIKSKQDFALIDIYKNHIDFILFDNLNPGSGESFNWELLKNLECKIPWFLSGGININNIEQAIENFGAKYIDISSGIEKNKAIKSNELIIKILEKFNKIRNK